MYSLLNKDYLSSIVIVKLSNNIMDLQVKNELGKNCSTCHEILDINKTVMIFYLVIKNIATVSMMD